jgi:hypothetical protein
MEIKFNKEKSKTGNMYFHSGVFTRDGKEYLFTLCEMRFKNCFPTYEVSWPDETPENADKVEEEIENAFLK